MAGFGILQSLVGELRTLTQTEIAGAVEEELKVYREKRLINEAELRKYSATLQLKYEKENLKKIKKLELQRLDDEAKYSEKIEDRISAKKKIVAEEIKDLEERRTELQEETKLVKLKSRLALEEQSAKKREAAIDRASKAMAHNVEMLSAVPGKAMAAVSKGINEYIGAFSKYFTAIEVGLQGTGRGFDSSKSLLDRTIGLSPVVKQTEVLERLEDYVKRGILRDTELRATLATVGTKIVNTFNSLDPTLLSLTKILKEDTSVARIGMETALTRYMAGAYQDTSYFAQGINENVSASMFQALSQMDKERGLELEYAVQKWIGSFVSVGVSEETAKKIADGLGYLTSGNISSLTSDNQLMNLMVSASRRGGVDLSTILQQGAGATDIDRLMKGLYDQVREIAESGDRVVKSQYAGLYGMTIADIAAMQNLSAEKVGANLTDNLSTARMERLTQDEIGKAMQRIATGTLIENALDNVMSVMGEKIASQPVMNIMWKLADMTTQAGGIRMPGALALGTGLAQLPDIDQLMKMGLITASVLGSAGDIIASLGNKGAINLEGFKSGKISSMTSAEQIAIGQSATVSNVGATAIGEVSKDTLAKSSMAQVQDLVTLTGQDLEMEERGATSADIDRLIRTVEDEGRKNRGEYSIQNNGPLSTVRWG